MSNEEFNVENLQMQIDNIEGKVDELNEKTPTREEMHLSNKKLIEDVLEQADERYAPKWTERVVTGLVGAVLLWFVNQVLGLI